MANDLKRKAPQGWPEDIPLPTEEEVEKAVREGEEKLRKQLEEIRRKNPPSRHGHEYIGFLSHPEVIRIGLPLFV